MVLAIVDHWCHCHRRHCQITAGVIGSCHADSVNPRKCVTTGVVDTGAKFATSVKDAGGKFATGVPLVSNIFLNFQNKTE
jgi:hypothetical protein